MIVVPSLLRVAPSGYRYLCFTAQHTISLYTCDTMQLAFQFLLYQVEQNTHRNGHTLAVLFTLQVHVRQHFCTALSAPLLEY